MKEKQNGITTINTFKKGEKEVVCIGMIHVADLDFYKSTQKLINSFEFGFHEGLSRNIHRELSLKKRRWIKKLMKKIPKNGLYTSLSALLDLVPQKLHISYPKKWVRADISWEHLVDLSSDTALERLYDVLNLLFQLEAIHKTQKDLEKKEKDGIELGYHELFSGLYSAGKFFISAKYMSMKGKVLDNKSEFENYIGRSRDKVVNRYLKDWIDDNLQLNLPNKCAVVYGQAHMAHIESYLIEQGFVCIHSETKEADKNNKIFDFEEEEEE